MLDTKPAESHFIYMMLSWSYDTLNAFLTYPAVILSGTFQPYIQVRSAKCISRIFPSAKHCDESWATLQLQSLDFTLTLTFWTIPACTTDLTLTPYFLSTAHGEVCGGE